MILLHSQLCKIYVMNHLTTLAFQIWKIKSVVAEKRRQFFYAPRCICEILCCSIACDSSFYFTRKSQYFTGIYAIIYFTVWWKEAEITVFVLTHSLEARGKWKLWKNLFEMHLWNTVLFDCLWFIFDVENARVSFIIFQ
jgi:hypothetical protein